MTDMTFGFGERGDAPFWPRSAGPGADAAGPQAPTAGQPARRRRRAAPVVAADWTDRLSDYLRRQHPVKTADAVAARCRGQISAEQVRKWLHRGSAPGGAALLWLATCYGPSLLVSLFGPCPLTGAAAPAWLDAAVQAQRADELGARLLAMRAELDQALERARP